MCMTRAVRGGCWTLADGGVEYKWEAGEASLKGLGEVS